MKRILITWLALVLAAPALPAAATADADYEAFQQLLRVRPPGTQREMGVESHLTWLDEHRQRLSAAGLAFHASHPADARRWDVVYAFVQQPPFFAQGFGPDVARKGPAAAIVDEPAKAAWERQAAELKAALLAAADAPARLKEAVEWAEFARDFRATTAAKAKGEAFDYGPFRARFDAHALKYAGLDNLAARAADYLGALETSLPGSSEGIWRHLLQSPDAGLREKAAAQLELRERMRRPVELAFTAADGREVDLARLRGKVVLIDFWATWCGPCIVELPNIRRVYAEYRDKGFEIVGVSLENAKLAPGDTPDQSAAKLTAARQVLLDFVDREQMPWPQHFDGRWWQNEISTQYAIKSIPAMFLLDQEGRIVSTNARGEKLEAEVKRLLKL